MKSITAIAFSFCLAGLSLAQEKIEQIKTLDGKTYNQVFIRKVEPDQIRITHETGVATITYENIPDDIKNKLGMSDEAALERREMIASKKNLEAAASQKEKALSDHRIILIAKIFQVTESGVLLKDIKYSDGTKEEIKSPYRVAVGGPTALRPNDPVKYEIRYNSKWQYKVRDMPQWPIFVECDNSGYVDGDSFSSVAYSDGTFAYENIQGARKTVPAYTTSENKILTKLGLDDD